MNANSLSDSLGDSRWTSFYGAFNSCSASPYLFFLRYWDLNNHKKLLEFKSHHHIHQKENLGCCGFYKEKGSSLVLDSEDEKKTTMKDHLAILVNGIGGGPGNWKFMEEQFRERAAPNMMVYVSASNAYSKTLDGFDVMGKRLADEVIELVQAHPELRKISFVSHSMGGLITRYAIGLLYRTSNDSNNNEKDIKNDVTSDSLNDTDIILSENLSHNLTSMDIPPVDSQSTSIVNGHTQEENIETQEENFFNCVDFSSEEVKFSDPVYLPLEEGENTNGKNYSGAKLNENETVNGNNGNSNSIKSKSLNSSSSSMNGMNASSSNDQINVKGGKVAGLEPINFISIASPHLGCRGKGHFPILFSMEFLESFGPKLAPLIGGRSGMHLFLGDGENPLLLRMVTDCEEAPFLSALASFHHRTLYSNASWDQMVGWRTSSIRRASEMPKLPKKESDPRYRHVMHVEDANKDISSSSLPASSSSPSTPPFLSKFISLPNMPSSSSSSSSFTNSDPSSSITNNSNTTSPDYVTLDKSSTIHVSPPIPPSIPPTVPEIKVEFEGMEDASEPCSVDSSQKSEKKERHKEMEEIMLNGLQKLSWKRVDVCFSNARLPFLAHNLIQVKNEWAHADGSGVVWHIIDHLEP